MTTVAIKPVTVSPSNVTPPVIANAVQITNVDLQLGKSASAYVCLGVLGESESFTLLTRSTVAMTDAQYAKWGADDDYAVNCFLLNANLERA